jgi:hypothetical protein
MESKVGEMTFQFNKGKVLSNWIFIGLFSFLYFVSLCMRLYRAGVHGLALDPSAFLLFSNVGMGIYAIWHVPTLIGRRIEVTESEIKLVNRSGRVVKSRRFDEISKLALGTLETPPRNHWMIFADGKKWLVSKYCDNFDALIRLIEERAGLSFVEPISKRKLKSVKH